MEDGWVSDPAFLHPGIGEGGFKWFREFHYSPDRRVCVCVGPS